MNKSITLSERDIARFWSKVEIGNPDECWEWKAGNNGRGYGKFYVGGDGNPQRYAHRISWSLANGDIPEGLILCHKCDNPKCINPDHLFLGTQAENMQDASKKGRCKPSMAHGNSSGHNKIDEKDIPDVKKMIAEGVSLKTIADIYGVSKQSIFHIKTGRNWSWIT